MRKSVEVEKAFLVIEIKDFYSILSKDDIEELLTAPELDTEFSPLVQFNLTNLR